MLRAAPGGVNRRSDRAAFCGDSLFRRTVVAKPACRDALRQERVLVADAGKREHPSGGREAPLLPHQDGDDRRWKRRAGREVDDAAERAVFARHAQVFGDRRRFRQRHVSAHPERSDRPVGLEGNFHAPRMPQGRGQRREDLRKSAFS